MLAAAGAARSAFLHRRGSVRPLPADDPAVRGAARIAAIPGAIGALHVFPTGCSDSARVRDWDMLVDGQGTLSGVIRTTSVSEPDPDAGGPRA